MRIATWNLERGRTRAARAAQDEVLCALGADVVILTEPPASYTQAPSVVTSPAARRGRQGVESWVATVAASVEPLPLDLPFDRLAVAARARVNGRAVVVYASVLPWAAIRSHAPELVRDGESALDTFLRVLREQVADIRELRRSHGDDLVIWAGDFNQTVSGPNRSGSDAKRAALLQALDDLGFAAWNGEAAHAAEGLNAIDLICGPRAITPTRQGRIDPIRNDLVMSDHAGYWVEI